jgi:DNA/RNA-binding domain of Phe-tRNA-synthetase-like protein
MNLTVEPHPLLDAKAFVTTFPASLSSIPASETFTRHFAAGATAPMSSSDEVRGAIRELLRHGGYKPTGRGKPASEYLIRAVSENALSSINAAVDACNAVSLHAGLPISVVDLSRAKEPFRIAVAKAGETYVFNASGQAIDIEGLLCLYDADGPCANAVKDSQRTKTTPETTRTLSVIWGAKALAGRAAQTERWYRELLSAIGAKTEDVVVA